MILARAQQADRILNIDAPYERDEGIIGWRVKRLQLTVRQRHPSARLESLGILPSDRRINTPRAEPGQRQAGVVRDKFFVAKVDQLLTVAGWLAVVAFNAVLVQYRLNLSGEIESTRRPVPGRDFVNRLQRRDIQTRRRVSRAELHGNRRTRLFRRASPCTSCASIAPPCPRHPRPAA